MKTLAMVPFWIFMSVLTFPLVLVATAAIGSTVYASKVEPQENNDPIVFSNNTVWFGPFSVTTNVRGWAGACVIVGIVFTVVGLIGLFHFPTPYPVNNRLDAEHFKSGIK